jgi:hypothetical protein
MRLARPEGLATYDTGRTVRRRVDYAPGQLLRGRLSLFVDGHCGCGGPLPPIPAALYAVAAERDRVPRHVHTENAVHVEASELAGIDRYALGLP